MIKREAVLQMLASGLMIERNATIQDFTGEWRSLLDGDIEKTDEFINSPVIYEWQARPVLLMAVEGGTATSRSSALAAMIEAQLVLIEAAKEALLAAGLIDDLRPTEPDLEANNLWGAAGVKVAELTIEIDYWSDRSVG